MTDSGPENDIADRLYAAHVAFELAQWGGESRQLLLRQEVDAFWHWAQATPLHTLVPQDGMRAATRRLLLETTLPPSLSATLGRLAAALIELDVNRDTRVRDVIDKRLFDDGVTLIIELEHVRERVLRRFLDSPVYAAMVSEVLYQGLKDYMFSEQGVLSGIPGVSSLLRGSAQTVNRHAPGFEAQVEKRVRAYIEANLARTLARSQVRLLQSLDAHRIRALAADVWAQTRDSRLSMADLLADDDVDALADFGVRFWCELRRTDYAEQLLEGAVDAVYDHYGAHALTAVLEQFGITRDVLAHEVDELAGPAIDVLLHSGWLEALIKRRLRPFYASQACARVLAQ